MASKENALRSEEQKQRSKMLSSNTIKKDCVNLVLINVLVVMLFYGFFLYSYAFHVSQMGVIKTIGDDAPILFERYTDLMLSY